MNDLDLLKAKYEIEENLRLLKKMSIISLEMYSKLCRILAELSDECIKRKLT